MKLALLLLFVLAHCNQDFGKPATLTIISQNKHDLQGKPFNLTAMSAETQSISANHQLIRVVFAEPLDGCSPQTLDKFELSQKPTYLLVQGRDGGCTYSRKRHYAMKAGAMGIIIVDSTKGINNLKHKKGYNFHTFLMPEAEGDALIGGLQGQYQMFVARLNMGNAGQETILAQTWISSLNRKSYDYLIWYEAALMTAPILKQKLDWKPRFAYVANINGDNDAYVSSCACGGSFCSPQFHGQAADVVVREDIRAWMVHKLAPEKFLAYMRVFQQKCLDNYIQSKYAEDCASRILSELGLQPQQIRQNIDQFLLQCAENGANSSPQSTQLFEAMLLDRTKMKHVSRYPIFILNHELLVSNNQNELKSTLCRKLGLDKQEGCGDTVSSTSIMSTVLSGLFWALVLVFLMGAGALVVIYFRNRFRREVNKELKMQVSTAVEHYYQLSENSQTK